MHRGASGATAALLLAILLTSVGCAGGRADALPAQRSQSVEVRVRDADSGTPVRATVSAVNEDGRRTLYMTGPGGRAHVPGGTRLVRAIAGDYSQATARVADRPIDLRLYRRSRQSPEYGRDTARTRNYADLDLPVPSGVPRWRYEAPSLIEFPPSVDGGLAVFGVNGGRIFALDAADGSLRWRVRRPAAIASSPAVTGSAVFLGAMDGVLVALRPADGAELWSFSTGGSPIESSPLVLGSLVVFGAWNGTLYALDRKTGTLRWTHRAAAAIKSSAAYSAGVLVVGDYGGTVYGLDPKDGSLRWTNRDGARYYGGAAISDGIAVIGDVGGAARALELHSGRTLWTRAMPSWVYSSPAISDGTVFIGSYGGRLDALALADGRRRWSFDAGERISGSATVVGGAVYFSTLSRPGGRLRTFALDIARGRVLWQTADGRYTPAVAAGRRIYIVGVRSVEAYEAP